jgi:hypothetical protein
VLDSDARSVVVSIGSAAELVGSVRYRSVSGRRRIEQFGTGANRGNEEEANASLLSLRSLPKMITQR